MLAADGKNLPFLVQDFGSQPGVIQMQALLINMDKAGHLKPRHFAYAAKFHHAVGCAGFWYRIIPAAITKPIGNHSQDQLFHHCFSTMAGDGHGTADWS